MFAYFNLGVPELVVLGLVVAGVGGVVIYLLTGSGGRKDD